MKTAVEYLMEEMLSNGYITQENIERSYWLVHEAKQMEKEQIVYAYNYTVLNLRTKDGEQYYNETYKK